MVSLDSCFQAYERDYPNHSTFVNFTRAVEGKQLSKSRLGFYFRKFVKKDEYAKSDVKKLLKWLHTKSATQKQGYFTKLELKTGKFCSA